jgi:hypothetical protein
VNRSAEEPPQPRAAAPVDWPVLVAELQSFAEARLGKRAKKVNDLLGSARLSRNGIKAAIHQIEHMDIRFVDPVVLGDLAYEMELRLAAHAGTPPPARLGLSPDETDLLLD